MNASPVQTLFNRIAPVYDDLNQQLSFGLHRVWKLMAVKWANPQPGDYALDVCCGSGDLAFLLAQQVGTTGKVVGVDFSVEQLAIAQQRTLTQYPHHHLTWQEGDALHLPFPDQTFDCATMGYGLRNVPDIPRSLQELHRVLKPKATVAILDFNHPSTPWMKTFQQWYLDQIVVPTAQKFNVTSDYAYIAHSLEHFPTGPQQVQLAQQAGFKQVTHYPIAGGLMGVLVLTTF